MTNPFASLLSSGGSANSQTGVSKAATTPPQNQPYTANAWNTGGSSGSFTSASLFNSWQKYLWPLLLLVAIVAGIVFILKER